MEAITVTKASHPPLPLVVQDVDMKVFSLLGAIWATVQSMELAVSDATNAMTQLMQMDNVQINPLMQKWAEYFNQLLSTDAQGIGTDPQKQAEFNADSNTSTGSTTQWGSFSSMVSQQISTMTQSINNLMSQANSAGVSFAQFAAQNWVI